MASLQETLDSQGKRLTEVDHEAKAHSASCKLLKDELTST